MDQEQLSNKTNPNTSKTLYQKSDIMKCEEGNPNKILKSIDNEKTFNISVFNLWFGTNS